MAQEAKDTVTEAVLYMAMELSKAKWKLRVESDGKYWRTNVTGGGVLELKEVFGRAKRRFGLPEAVRVLSCYEAGRDGFWVQRLLKGWGVENLVVDPSSIEVNRRTRRAKTDRVDLNKLGNCLRLHGRGEKVWKVVRVPDEEAEAGQVLHREMKRLKDEQGKLVNRIKGLLFKHGVRVEGVRLSDWAAQVEGFRTPVGAVVGGLQGELKRAGKRLSLVREQLKELEAEQERRARSLARKLLVALWRYLETGEVPQGAVLKAKI